MALRIEDVKAAGIKVDVDRLAETGFASISDEDRYRLKTQGVCAQRQVGVFMLRIRVPGGKATTVQLRRVADLAERYARPGVHVTTRGGLEIHHVRIEDVTAIWRELAEVGLTTKGTCGDTLRNVIACAHTGTYAGEVLPLEPFVALLHEHIVAISDGLNISRKINVAIACSPDCDEHVATSDVGFVATPGGAGALPTFTLWGAGGLGATPRLAIKLREGIAQTDMLAAFDAVVAIGARYADRSSRAKAKIKLLVENLGADRVRGIFDEEFARAKAADAGPVFQFEASPGVAQHDIVAPLAGVVAQKQVDRFTIPVLIPMGEIASQALRELAAIADRFAGGDVRLTPDQNAELQHVHGKDVAEVVGAVEAAGLRVRGRGGISDVVSCVGLEYCPLAVSHSMSMGEELSQAFASLRDDPRYVDFRIHVSGCPHSCAKHQVADIGLAGAITEVDGKRVEAYAFYLGGNARERRLGAMFPKKVPRTLVVRAIERLLRDYETLSLAGERFSQTVARIGTEPFFQTLQAALDGITLALPQVREGKLVVIGNGMAGARFVEELRSRASEAFEITVLGEESYGGYNRIMLSGVLGGFRAAEEIVTHPLPWYEDRRVTLRTGVRVVDIDRKRKIVTCSDGSSVAYDALVLATGSRPFVPRIEGLDAKHVFVFRTIDDCARIREAAVGARRAIVLGGGLLGLEAAAGLHALGVSTTVVHLMPTLMEQQLDREGGLALQHRIEAMGIAVHTNAKAARAYDDQTGRGIELADGRRIPGDLIVLCCGIVANTEPARAAGLRVERGIVVDDGMQTEDPSIFALGECAQHRGTMYGLVEPLWEQCVVLAERLSGKRNGYAGSRVGTKLKVAGVNVVALGEREPRPGDEAVAYLDGEGRYRRAIARGGVLVGAQVVGDASAAASFSKVFDRGAALPGSLLSLVFGGDGAPAAAPSAGAGNERVCICNDVGRSAIQRAIDAGAHDVAEIGRVTTAGTGCGTCRGELAAMVIAAQGAVPS
ncbi:MAG TPA: FAD-dependent oxidoreductase [Candidatus Acidoferrales bacterium]|nr:FAD-dependent oxidoreductase [Candidatus Acidoferrales bacterium]